MMESFAVVTAISSMLNSTKVWVSTASACMRNGFAEAKCLLEKMEARDSGADFLAWA
jgi:hypothetical protein